VQLRLLGACREAVEWVDEHHAEGWDWLAENAQQDWREWLADRLKCEPSESAIADAVRATGVILTLEQVLAAAPHPKKW
jgi:hypothetical protein